MIAYHERSTDDELVHGCLEQHRLAQKYLYQRYFGRLFGTALRYTGSRAEAIEVLNTAFVKIFASLSSYRGAGALGAWMTRIVFHTAIDHVRREAAFYRDLRRDDEADLPVENTALNDLGVEELYALIQELPPGPRTVFSMYVIDGYKHHEIAAALGIDEGTSKWRLNQARRTLQRRLETLQPGLTYRAKL